MTRTKVHTADDSYVRFTRLTRWAMRHWVWSVHLAVCCWLSPPRSRGFMSLWWEQTVAREVQRTLLRHTRRFVMTIPLNLTSSGRTATLESETKLNETHQLSSQYSPHDTKTGPGGVVVLSSYLEVRFREDDSALPGFWSSHLWLEKSPLTLNSLQTYRTST